MSDYRIVVAKKGLVTGLGLATAALLADYLGPSLRGEYAKIVNAAAVAVVMLNLGISNSYQASRRRLGVGAADLYATYTLYSGAALIALALLVAATISPTLGAVMLVSGASLIRLQLQSYGLVESIPGAARSSVTGSVGELLVVVLLWAVAPATLPLALAALIVKELVISVGSYLVIRASYRTDRFATGTTQPSLLVPLHRLALSIRGSLSSTRSLALVALTILITINYKVDVLLLSLLGVESAAVGIFAIGVLIADQLWIAADAFKEVQISKTARGGSARGVAVANRVALASTVLLYLAFLALGRPAIAVLFGADYAPSFEIAAFMLVANLFMIPCKILGAYFISINRIGAYLTAMALSVACNILLNLFLIPAHGVYGAISASIVSYSLAGTIVTLDFARHTGIRLTSALLLERQDFFRVFR